MVTVFLSLPCIDYTKIDIARSKRARYNLYLEYRVLMSQETIDILQIKESFKLIVGALNKAAKGGIYSIDEAYYIKLSTTNIDKLFNALESSITSATDIPSKTLSSTTSQ